MSYLFDKQGVIVVDASRYSEDDLIVAIDAGAEDIALDEDVFEVITEPADFTNVRRALEQAGVEIESADVDPAALGARAAAGGGRGRLMQLIDALEDNDDVGTRLRQFRRRRRRPGADRRLTRSVWGERFAPGRRRATPGRRGAAAEPRAA